MSILISVDELATTLSSSAPGPRPVILDVRWELNGPPGHKEYLAGHIPGAVYVDLETELSAHGLPTDGRHPVPSPGALQEAARRWGVDPDSPVVVYDAIGNQAAARAWWLLRWAGHGDVRILDGALPAWTSAGLDLATDDVRPDTGTVVLTGGGLPTIGLDEAATFPENGILLDARAPERFRGEIEPIDPKAGHIPGAVSAPTAANLAHDGRFRSADELRRRFADLGVTDATPVATYCGSGVTASHQVAALAIAGFGAALFPGSWSQWSNHDLPVATGD